MVDGQRVAVPSSPRRWHELADTIVALGGARLVACDARGGTLRATEIADDDDDAAPAAPAPSAPAAPRGAGSDLALMSSLLADAYRVGAETSMRALSKAIEEHTALVRLLADRLGAIELAWQRSLVSHARLVGDLAQARADAAAASDGSDPVLAQLIPMIASGGGKAAK
jgi:hypothetical protein